MTGNQPAKKAVAWACAGGLLTGPAVIAGQAVAGSVHAPEALGGAVLGTAFFASTGIVALLSKAASLKANLLNAYLFKFSLLMLTLLVVPQTELDRPTAAIAVVAAAVTYLAVQTFLLTRRRSSA